MIGDFFRAIGQLGDPATRGVIWRSLLLAGLSFVGLVVAVSALLRAITVFDADLAWLDSTLDIFGGLAATILAWLLFPAVVAAAAGLFLDGVIDQVERRHYPHLPPPRPQTLPSQIAGSLRLLGSAVLINLLALPLYIYLPLLNIVIWLVVNGYLIGREYFEMVAARRLEADLVQRLRVTHSLSALASGMVVAGLMAIPLLNLVAPVLGIAFITHRVMRLPPLQYPH